METFATAVAGPLRCVLARLALAGGGESFFFTFMEEARLERGAITDAVPIDPALARASLGGNAAPANDAQHVATIAHVIDNGPIRADLKIGQGASPWIVEAFFQQIDAMAQAAAIAAATPVANQRTQPPKSPWSKPGGPI